MSVRSFVENQFRGHSGYGLFACGVDIEEYDAAVGEVERRCKFVGEVACTRVQVRLEGYGKLALGIQRLDGCDALTQLVGMMRVVVDDDVSAGHWLLEMELEAAFSALEACQGTAYGFVRQLRLVITKGYETRADSGHSVFDVDFDRNTERYVAYRVAEGMNNIKDYFASATAYIGGMEVAFIAAIGVATHSGHGTRHHLEPGVQQQSAISRISSVKCAKLSRYASSVP